MQNKQLKAKLLSKVKEYRAEFSTSRNTIMAVQRQVDILMDLIELVIVDEDANVPQQRGQMQRPMAMSQGGRPVFQSNDRPPTVDEYEQYDIQPTNETQIFMTLNGTKVIPPGYTGIPPFTLAVGQEVPHFPSLAEFQANNRRGVGVPSNITTQGQHPSGAPPGAAAVMSPAIGHTYADSISNPPLEAVVSSRSVQGALDGSLAHNRVLQGDPAGGAANITGRPVEAFPGGQAVTE